jgi:hypothetical protein
MKQCGLLTVMERCEKAEFFMWQRVLEDGHKPYISCHASPLMNCFQIHSLLNPSTSNFPLYSLKCIHWQIFCLLHYFRGAGWEHSEKSKIHNDIFEKVGGEFDWGCLLGVVLMVAVIVICGVCVVVIREFGLFLLTAFQNGGEKIHV